MRSELTIGVDVDREHPTEDGRAVDARDVGGGLLDRSRYQVAPDADGVAFRA